MPPELDLLVLGSGVAGLSAAVDASARGLRVGVLTKGDLDEATTRWAQGGVAAVLGGADSTDLHLADTLAAGAGLCDVDAVRIMVDEGPARVRELIARGAAFDRDPDGLLALAREGGHSVARVVHAGGVATGAEIERALVAAVRATAVVVLERWFAVDLLVRSGRCRGVSTLDAEGRRCSVAADHVLVATGGAGQLFAVTTNPPEATGDGVAMALRAGVAVADLEFVQFHPTALHHPRVPRPLLSEALRGHGALLRDDRGRRFVDELAPRDVVARAMTTRMAGAGVEHLWLDATPLEGFARRFPTLAPALADAGLDPATDWLPVAPAAHYAIGGILTDLDGSSALPGLWAAGEAACTGVHGANRLGSNSLLEGMVFARRVVDAIAGGRSDPLPTGALGPVLEGKADGVPAGASPYDAVLAGASPYEGAAVLAGASPYEGAAVLAGASPYEGAAVPAGASPYEGAAVPAGASPYDGVRLALQWSMTRNAGTVRDAGSLARAAEPAIALPPGADDRPSWELRNLAALRAATVAAATARTESRGAHHRRDHPDPDPFLEHRLVIQ